MTIEEAIDILDDNRVFTHACESTEEEQGQALYMSIKSLEAMKKLHEACYTNGLSGDAFCDEVCDILNEFEEIIEFITNL